MLRTCALKLRPYVVVAAPVFINQVNTMTRFTYRFDTRQPRTDAYHLQLLSMDTFHP